jgi:hypothetical protein
MHPRNRAMSDSLLVFAHVMVAIPIVWIVVFVRLLVIEQPCRLVASDYALVPSLALDCQLPAPYTTRPEEENGTTPLSRQVNRRTVNLPVHAARSR